MVWETCKLYQEVKTQNAYKQWITSWEEIEAIEIVLSNNLYTNVTNDIVYRIYAPTAITKFKAFEDNAKYKVANSDSEYEVSSFNKDGRYAQLILKKVVL